MTPVNVFSDPADEPVPEEPDSPLPDEFPPPESDELEDRPFALAFDPLDDVDAADFGPFPIAFQLFLNAEGPVPSLRVVVDVEAFVLLPGELTTSGG